MRHILTISVATLMLAGCLNGVEGSVVEREASVYEHVLVHWLEGPPDGSRSGGTGSPPKEPRRRLTITPDYVIIESYDGFTQLIPMNRLHSLMWKPNPDPPQN